MIEAPQKVERILSPVSNNCPESTHDADPDIEPLCSHPSFGDEWISNCVKLFKNSDVPKNALRFTMKAFSLNMNKF